MPKHGLPTILIDEVDRFLDQIRLLPAVPREEVRGMIASVLQHPTANQEHSPIPLKGFSHQYKFKPTDRIIGSHGPGTVLGFNLNTIGYDGERYPYVVGFDNGYCDYYSENDLKPE